MKSLPISLKEELHGDRGMGGKKMPKRVEEGAEWPAGEVWILSKPFQDEGSYAGKTQMVHKEDDALLQLEPNRLTQICADSGRDGAATQCPSCTIIP